jgi:hypothetical protein
MSCKCQRLPSFLMCNIYVSRLKELLKNTLLSIYLSNTRYVLVHSILYSNMHMKYCRPHQITEKSCRLWSCLKILTWSSWNCCQTILWPGLHPTYQKKNNETNNKKSTDYMSIMSDEVWRELIRQKMGTTPSNNTNLFQKWEE